MSQRSTLLSECAPTPPYAMPMKPAGPMARGPLQTLRGLAEAPLLNRTSSMRAFPSFGGPGFGEVRVHDRKCPPTATSRPTALQTQHFVDGLVRQGPLEL